MTVYWGRRDTWTIIGGVRDRHRRDEHGRCRVCRSVDCRPQDQAASYLNFVDPALLRHHTLCAPPAGHLERPPN